MKSVLADSRKIIEKVIHNNNDNKNNNNYNCLLTIQLKSEKEIDEVIPLYKTNSDEKF